MWAKGAAVGNAWRSPSQPLAHAVFALGLTHQLVPVGQQAVQAQLGGLRPQPGVRGHGVAREARLSHR